MSFYLLGALQTFAAFGVVSLGAAALVAAAWSLAGGRVSRLAPASQARLLLALRLFPTALGIVASLGLALPSFVALEPRDADEGPGLLLWICASAGLAVAARGGWRLSASLRATRRIVRRWSDEARPVSVAGVELPVFRVDTDVPIVAIAGARRPRLFIAGPVLDGCRPPLVSAMAAHEVGHWRSADNVKRLLIEAAADPLDRFRAGREILSAWDAAAEEAADDEALVAGVPPADLAESLICVARLSGGARFPEAAGAAAFYRGESLERRVRRLVEGPAGGARGRGGRRILAVGLLLFALAWVAAAHALLAPVHHLFEHAVHPAHPQLRGLVVVPRRP